MLRLTLILIICINTSIAHCAYISDGIMQIRADKLAIHNHNLLQYSVDVIIKFKDHIVYTNQAEIKLTKARGIKTIASLILDGPLKVINTMNKDYILANKASYSAATKTLTLEGDVKIQQHNNLLVVDCFMLKLPDK